MGHSVFLAYFSLSLGQLMFRLTASICEVLPMANCQGTVLYTLSSSALLDLFAVFLATNICFVCLM